MPHFLAERSENATRLRQSSLFNGIMTETVRHARYSVLRVALGCSGPPLTRPARRGGLRLSGRGASQKHRRQDACGGRRTSGMG